MKLKWYMCMINWEIHLSSSELYHPMKLSVMSILNTHSIQNWRVNRIHSLLPTNLKLETFNMTLEISSRIFRSN